MIIPEWLSRETIEVLKLYYPISLKQIARDNIKIDDKQLKKELAKKMNNPNYFTDRNLKVGFNITLGSHDINHANFKLTITPDYHDFGNEFRYFNKIIKEILVIYARLINQYKFKYQTVFSARFDQQDEDN